MLLPLKDDDTAGSLCLCHLFCVLWMTMISGYICTKVCLYTIAICTNGAVINMWLWLLLVAICILCHWLDILYYWYASICILCNYWYICVTVCAYLIIQCVDCLWVSVICSCVYLCKLWQVLIYLPYVLTGWSVLIWTCPFDEYHYILITTKSLWSADVNDSFWLMPLCPNNNSLSGFLLILPDPVMKVS